MTGELTRDIFFENHPDPMLIYELGTRRILVVNNTFTVRYGYTGADLDSLRLDDLHTPEELERLASNVAAVTDGLDRAGVWTTISKSGEIILAEVTSHTLTYEGNACELCVIRDVTASVRFERERAALLKREEMLRNRAEAAAYHFQSLFEAAPGKFIVLTPETYEIVAISDQYLEAIMRRRADIAGRPLFEVFPDNPDEPLADGRGIVTAALERVCKTGLPEVMPLVRYPVERPAAEGGGFEDRWWMSIFTPVKAADGTVSYIIGRSEDVTEFVNQSGNGAGAATALDAGELPDSTLMVHARELREATFRLNEREARIRTAERLLALGQWRFDLQTQKLEWSESTFRMYGLDPDQYQHQPDYDLYVSLVHPDDRAKMEQQFADFLSSGERSYEFWHRIIRPDGRVVTVRGVAERTATPQGEVTTGFVQDITGQLETDARLNEAYAQLTFTGRAARIGYWRYDLEKQTVHWSEETAAIHDLEGPREVTLEEAAQFYMPEDIGRIGERVSECVENGVPYDEVLRLRTAGGRLIYTRSIGEPVRDASGKVTAIHGAFQDISELMAARQESEELAERLRRTLNTMSEAFYLLDADLRLTFINDEAERVLRKPRSALLGESMWDAFPDASTTELTTQYERALQTGEAVSFTYWFEPFRAWYRINAHPSPDGLAVYFQDITEEREAQQQLHLLGAAVANANDVVIITEGEIRDDGPRIVYVNEAFETVFGYTREEALGGSTRRLHGPLTSPETITKVRRAMDALRPVRAEIVHYTRSGEGRWMDIDIVPILDAGGKLTHWLAVERDITERKRSEEALRIARDEAREANRLKSEFLANMSHEIRTPLNGVLGMSQLLARTPLDARQQKMINTVQSSGRALLSIINDILDISKIEAGLMVLELEPVEIGAVCEQAMAAVTATAQEKGLDLSMTLSPDLPACMLTDRRRLGQVLINLLGNAVKFTAAGSVRLSVAPHAKGRVRFEVADTGPGIAPGQAEIIFDRFRQLDASFSRAHEGAGLGLALCREFAGLMAGEVSVDSVPGEGSRFYLDLPLTPARRESVPEAAAPAPALGNGSGGLSILVAEDNPVNRETLAMFLDELELDAPVCVGDGRQAVETALARDFDVIIMDISMPVLSGLDAIRQIRASQCARARVPILALTAHASSQDREQCLQAGANDYLAKPVDLEALRSALSRMTQNRAGR